MVRPLATSALALILGAGPILADVTPAQVWENLQTSGADYGYQVTGTVEDAGGTLTVTDAVFSRTGDGGNSTMTVPQMTFQQTGDAKVRVVIEGDVAVDSRFSVPAPADPEETAEGAEPAPDTPGAETGGAGAPEMVEMTMTGTISASGNETLVSGTPEDMLYEYRFPTLAFDFTLPTEASRGDATIPVTGTITDLAGSQRSVRAGDGIQTTHDLNATRAEVQVAATMPGDQTGAGGGTMNFQVAVNALAAQGTGTTPGQPFDLGTQMTEALAAGLMLDSALTFQSLEGSFDLAGKNDRGEEQTAQGSFASGASNLSFTLSGAGLAYKAGSADARAEVTLGNLPFPISYGIQQISADMLIPVARGEAPQPFNFAYALQGLTFGDGLWNLFDPQNQLPRDPASLSVDLSGDVVLNQNLFDVAPPSVQTDANGMPVAENPLVPDTLTVNRVALDAVGAKADLTGTLEFGDNPDQPVGRLNGTFEGINGLMDKVVAMGLVPEQQAMGMRMMLAMFAQPDQDNPDRLTTEIEFREGGRIFANGQQIR